MNVQSELEKQKKSAAKAKREAQIKHDEFLENLKITVAVGLMGLLAVGFLVFAMASMAAITGM